MTSFMEFIYIDSENLARKTGLARSCDRDADTWAEFRSYRHLGVDIKQARFLLDYHNRKGDLSDTIALDEAGFWAITYSEPESEAHYRKIDSDYWKEARSEAA